MADWHDYATLYPGGEHTVSGTLKVGRAVYSPQLDNRRDLVVYLPPSYGRGARRYPVIYFHDGQNMFDAATSNSGEWQADETLETLAREGIEAIAVGIPNTGGGGDGGRLDEYGPWYNSDRDAGGRGDGYLAFLVETVKPLIDADFRTQPDRAHTSLAGSSMGGLISLYAFLRQPDVFGGAGVFSPAFWFSREAIFQLAEESPFVRGRIYIDVGTMEEGIAGLDKYLTDARRMRGLLRGKGYRDGVDLLYAEEDGGIHHESAWARRLPYALRFLLG